MTSPKSSPGIESVLILAKCEKPDVRTLADELVPWLAERVERVWLESDPRDWCSRKIQGELAAGAPEAGPFDLVVVLGGDGSLLGAVRAFGESPVPLLGINFGRVGFLASTAATRWRETLQGVLDGEGLLEQRTRLLVEWQANGEPRHEVALNDVVLQRSSHQGMLTIGLAVGEDWVTNFRADGLVFATASGSTAYSLSAGGPILEPAVPGIVVTPIASQGLSNRPIVLADDKEITVSVQASPGITTLAVDGQSYHSLVQGQEVCIRRHPEPYPLYVMPGLDPYRRLRSRLGWGRSVERDAGTE